MYVTFTILNYPKYFFFAGFFSMVFFRIALISRGKKTFTKLMGTGRNGSFDLFPDFCQWTIMQFSDALPPISLSGDIDRDTITHLHGNFIASWIKLFKCETGLFVLKITQGHGNWDKSPLLSDIPESAEVYQPVAVLTRATIRLSKLPAFWKQVPYVNKKIANATGLLFSIGTGEVPLIKQATFSIWQSIQAMKDYAYNDPDHLQAIQKTRKEKWYREELFLRMIIISAKGSIKGRSVSNLGLKPVL